MPRLSQTDGSCTDVTFKQPGTFHLLLEGTAGEAFAVSRYARAVFICEEDKVTVER